MTFPVNFKKSFKLFLVVLGLIPSVSYAHDYPNNSLRYTEYLNHEIHRAYDATNLINKLPFEAFKQGYIAYENTHQKRKPLLSIVDYRMPSTEKRFFVINMDTHRLLYRTFVAQGENTGLLWARYFSNQFGTHESSLGTFVTGDSYYGNVGYSLRIYGLTPGQNTNAYARDVVVHGASYVSQRFINQHGYLGRSWGCMALPLNRYRNVINTIQGGSVIYSYV